MNKKTFIKQYFEDLKKSLDALPLGRIEAFLDILDAVFAQGRKVFICGNGGSAATASHMANDLLKGVAKTRGHGFQVISLADNVAILTAIANDFSYEEIFSQQLVELGKKGDLLIVISASGNSPNILKVLAEAKRMELQTVGLLGMTGGKAATAVDLAIIAPANDYGPVEDLHLIINHLIYAYFRRSEC